MSFTDKVLDRKLMNLEQIIVREIEKYKSISFARFMELALYLPEYGYYEQKERVGRSGDFYTSVSVGPLFGELLSFAFVEWIGEMGMDACQLLESGAHNGQLARDILTSLQKDFPETFPKIRYCILEPSIKHQQWQQETLKSFSNVTWVKDWDEVETFAGFIFSNELLDAIPFLRIQWSSQLKRWQEMRVGWDGSQFIWKLEFLPTNIPAVPEVPSELAEVLPDGFQTEICVDSLAWWKSAVGKLDRGKIMAIDYGFHAEDFLKPERSRGTARCYKSHRVGDNLLSGPGEQDITCHVNFSALLDLGEIEGLQTEFFGSQSKFLTAIMEKHLREGSIAVDKTFARQFQTLTHPAHLGSQFKALVQRRAPPIPK